ncbi:immunoglobulin-like domain-containing protein [Pseudomonas beijingensis]|uniref:immunoglobulin-like domain-containing protein n=1 Tax=Pseudomonas beijingensis TaxID=2954101 RepID=UPI003F71083A
MTLTATPTVNENGTITYTATLTGADGKPVIAQNGPVTVTLESGKTTPSPPAQARACWT